MKRFWISVIAVALIAVAAIAPAAAQEEQEPLEINLEEVEGSGVSGTATLTEENGSTLVEIQLDGTPEDGVHPAHIHEGTCDDLGDVVFPLEDVVDGMSESTVEASIDDILAADHAINVHLSADEMDVYVACGEVVEADGAVEEDDDAAVTDDEDDATTDEDDDAVTDEDDDAAMEDDDDAVEEDDDTAVTDEDDDAAMDDDENGVGGPAEEDDAEDVVPATGSISGMGPETGMLLMAIGAGLTLGAGLLIRRRSLQF